MNKKYNKLPRDLQSLVDMMSGEYQERYALMWNEIELVGKAFGTTKGMEYIEYSDQEAPGGKRPWHLLSTSISR